MPPLTRRAFLHASAQAVAAAALQAQIPGERPATPQGVTVEMPLGRLPVGLIIDDSTALVNLNRFAMPQFDAAFAGANPAYHKPWRDWPAEIPDAFVRKFGEWAAGAGVKGKYSMVPFPACVGRLDRMLPGWTPRALAESLELVRTVMMPNWDIHPEMVTHTRVIDLKTGHPYPELTLKFMENWDWTTGRSADEIGSYMAYALEILKGAGLTCEGVTTPGGFAGKALPQLSQGTLQAVRAVFKAELPHYFRHIYESGKESVAPRVEYASGLASDDPRAVVSIIGCTGDWTGGWDCSEPVGADRFITPDLAGGRVVEVLERGEPAMMLAHWTGIYWNREERGLAIFQEVVRRLTSRYGARLLWMKLSEVARYWAAKELTRITVHPDRLEFQAPFACPNFTVKWQTNATGAVGILSDAGRTVLKEVPAQSPLQAGTWSRAAGSLRVAFDLPRGKSKLTLAVG